MGTSLQTYQPAGKAKNAIKSPWKMSNKGTRKNNMLKRW